MFENCTRIILLAFNLLRYRRIQRKKKRNIMNNERIKS